MKIEKLTDDTIRITLNKKDFETRNIDASKLKVNSPAYQQLLWDIIEHAEIEFGFDVTEGQILVETVTNVTGEYVVTITRTEERRAGTELPKAQQQIMERIFGIFRTGMTAEMNEEESEEDAAAGPAENEARETAQGRGLIKSIRPASGVPYAMKYEQYDIIYFSNFEHLLSVCQMFPQCRTIPSMLYAYKRGYYLVLKVSKRNLTLVNLFESCALEFDGLYVMPEVFLPILEEHGTKVVKRGAISFLLRQFQGEKAPAESGQEPS